MTRQYLTIPECRELLYELAAHLDTKGRRAEANTLRRIIVHMIRRPAHRKTAPKSEPMTPEMRRAIRAFALAHVGMSHQEIGAVFHVNTGRVSESIRGFRR